MTFFMNFSIQGELQLFVEELYQHLTPSFLEKLAREIAFVQRKRKFSGHDLATICVWISQRVASDSLVRLCSQLHAVTGTLMSPEGLNKRFNKKAVCFLKHIFSTLLKNKICETSVIPGSSISYFQRIRILDATDFPSAKTLS
ncbi:Transposase for insertion sequence element IS231B [Bacillus mycoides DSM 2048]|nr:Transposase for insertion sequence element IS231B [Bacillus mycoides DSM 2048]